MATSPNDRTPKAWPPFVALMVGFLMFFVAFPNPLRVPLNNPNATAELAPIPGKSDSNQQSNLGETGFVEDGGIGTGDGGPGGPGALPPPPPPPPGQDVPLQFVCYEGRQSPDPLSPPCSPYFNGNNFGNTWKGVTKSEIKVIFYNDLCVKGDLTGAYKPSDECGSESDFETVNIVRTIKAQLKYFQSHFQTYGRRVRLIGQKSQGQQPENRRNDAGVAATQYSPFAAVFLGDNAQDYFAELARSNIPSFGLNFDVPRNYYDANRPYVWSFMPDQETEARWSASFICRTLRPHQQKATFSPDPTLAAKPRKIGFVYGGKQSPRGPAMHQSAQLLLKYVGEECAKEGISDAENPSKPYAFDWAEEYTNAGAEAGANAALIIRRMQEKEINTLICYCIPVPSEQTVSKFQGAATAAGYYPEWYWDHASAMDRPIWHQTFGKDSSQRHVSYGVTYFWRQPAFREQMHYKSYVEATKDQSQPNVRFNFTIYHLFLNLFTAIQAAGPKLNPEKVETGMFTFKYTTPDDWRLPTGGYGLDGPGTYTFIDTAMGWFWDPTGTPPGGTEGEGCMRVMAGRKDEAGKPIWGARYAGEGAGEIAPAWPEGHAALAEARERGQCTEDTRKLRDPGAGDLH